MWRKRVPMHCWWEGKLVQPLWKTVWGILKKLQIEIAKDPVIPLLGIYLRTTKTRIQKDVCSPVFIKTSLVILEISEEPKCPPTDEE